jgi:DNA-binding transcriptional LysR family regulator
MRQDQLDGLVTFVAVAQTQGFSAAAVRLGVSPSAVSQSIRQLEARLGAALFNRTTRSVSLTEAGVRFLVRVGPAVQELASASEELVDTSARPSGLLRLNVPRVGYAFVLQPILAKFLKAYPDINMEVAISSALVDIVEEGFDAGIRYGTLVERDMVGVGVGPQWETSIIASPAYLAQYGTPLHPRDLFAHDCIGFRFATSGALERWEFEQGEENLKLAVSGRLVLNDVGAVVQASIDGLGLGNVLSTYSAAHIAEGRLVRVLEDWSPKLPGLTLYYPDRKRVPLKLRALIDFLRAQHSQD